MPEGIASGIPGVMGRIQERKITGTPGVPFAPAPDQGFPVAVHRKLSKVSAWPNSHRPLGDKDEP